MTLLASWIGIDTHGPTSAYMVSDSRISWGMTRNFDYGKKVFASSQYPEIFGYAGKVIFPSIVLAQLIEMIDAGILFTSEMTCSEKHAAVFEKLCHSFSKYPEDCVPHPVQILHISRDTNFEKYPAFSCRLFTWSAKSGWHCKTIEIPNESGILCVLGRELKSLILITKGIVPVQIVVPVAMCFIVLLIHCLILLTLHVGDLHSWLEYIENPEPMQLTLVSFITKNAIY